MSSDLCSDCPPVGYPTDETRCAPCPRRTLDDAPCTGCGGMGITYQTARRCACTLTEEEHRAWQETREGMNR